MLQFLPQMVVLYFFHIHLVYLVYFSVILNTVNNSSYFWDFPHIIEC